jgi:LPXTG-motif cell wall-anchored protein
VHTTLMPSVPGMIVGGAQLANTGAGQGNLLLTAVGAAMVAAGSTIVGLLVRRNRREAHAAGIPGRRKTRRANKR